MTKATAQEHRRENKETDFPPSERLIRIEETLKHVAPALAVEKLRTELYTGLEQQSTTSEKIRTELNVGLKDVKIWMMGIIITILVSIPLAIVSTVKLLSFYSL